MRHLRIVISVSVVLVLGACGDATAPEAADVTPVAEGPVDAQGTWQLESGTVRGEAVPLVPGYRITLTIEADGVAGRAACNLYGGTARIKGTSVSLIDMSMTQMGCSGDLGASEDVYIAALGVVDTIERDGSRLDLSGPQVLLRFEAVPDVDDALFGRIWVLEATVQGDLVISSRGERATLELTAGRLSASTGCRRLTGTYIVRGDEILDTSLSARGRCAPELSRQDGHVVGVLGDGFTAAIEGDRLTLTSRGGVGLHYRAG